jgi:hypothetical protein
MGFGNPASAQSSPPAPAALPSPGASGANGITQAAVQHGAMACTSRINQVTNFLGFGPEAGAVLLVPPSQPDQRLLAVAMELPGERSLIATADFAPNQANGCGASYDAVAWWPEKCEEVATRHFSKFRNMGILKKNVTILDRGIATTVFLMPAGSGCVSVNKEVVL